MNLVRTVAGVLTMAALGLAGCSSGVEGTYTLDKATVKKAMEAAVAGQSGGGIVFDFFTQAIDQVEMTIELKADGTVALKSTLPTGGWTGAGPGRRLEWFTREDNDGRWKAEGETIVVTGAGNSITCLKSGARLNCQSNGTTFFFPLVFVRS
jgi:hypothetical protein